MTQEEPPKTLTPEEKIYYRDQLRAARYAALEDAEGFPAICFAIEALGMRLCGQKSTLGQDEYKISLKNLSQKSLTLHKFSSSHPNLFTRFDALYKTLKNARNDAMHTGAYARHATVAAIELCIGLEEAIMSGDSPTLVRDVMVKSPITVEPWQPVALARQIMLMHSFSFIPILINNQWMLVSEQSMAHYMIKNNKSKAKNLALAKTIQEAEGDGLVLIKALTVRPEKDVSELLMEQEPKDTPRLWVATDESQRICGVLSPFELM